MTQVLAKVSKSIKWSWTQWCKGEDIRSVMGLLALHFFFFKCRTLTSCNPETRVRTHLPSHAAAVLVYTAGRQLNPRYCHFDACFCSLPLHIIFFLMNTQSGFHQNHPHPLHPSQEGAEVNILNISKKINDFFIHCTEQHCVTFFFLAYICVYLIEFCIFEIY